MDRYRLKNIIILILVLFNGFLLVSLAVHESAQRSAQHTAAVQLSALFEADGITLDPDSIPDAAPTVWYSMERDLSRERNAAAYLLGSDLRDSDQGGGIYAYSSSRGAALFRGNGSFEVAGTLCTSDTEAFCREFCKTFAYSEPVFSLDETGSGTASAVRTFDHTPVYNCTLTFTVDRGVLSAVSGTLLPEASAQHAQELSSPLAALTAFQQQRRQTGAVVSSVSEITLAYELQSMVEAPMSLVPTWCIATDVGLYYVNSMTGVVNQG